MSASNRQKIAWEMDHGKGVDDSFWRAVDTITALRARLAEVEEKRGEAVERLREELKRGIRAEAEVEDIKREVDRLGTEKNAALREAIKLESQRDLAIARATRAEARLGVLEEAVALRERENEAQEDARHEQALRIEVLERVREAAAICANNVMGQTASEAQAAWDGLDAALAECEEGK